MLLKHSPILFILLGSCLSSPMFNWWNNQKTPSYPSIDTNVYHESARQPDIAWPRPHSPNRVVVFGPGTQEYFQRENAQKQAAQQQSQAQQPQRQQSQGRQSPTGGSSLEVDPGQREGKAILDAW